MRNIIVWASIVCCLSSCEFTGDVTDVLTNVETHVTSTSTTTTTSTGTTPGTTRAGGQTPAPTNLTLYFGDTLNGDCTGCLLENAAYVVGGGVTILASSNAYLRYTLPIQPTLFAQVDITGFYATHGAKLIILHMTDALSGWVGETSLWETKSLIEVRQRDTELRFRVGGRNMWQTEYVYQGLEYGQPYVIGVSVTPTIAVLYVNGQSVASFSAAAFQPTAPVYLFVGGGVDAESLNNAIIASVAVFF